VHLGDQTEHFLGDPAVVGMALRRSPELAEVVDLAQVDAEVPPQPVGQGHGVLRESGTQLLLEARVRGRGSIDRLDEALIHAELGQSGRDVKPEGRAEQLAILCEHAVAVQVAIGGEVGDDLEVVLRLLKGARGPLPAVDTVAQDRFEDSRYVTVLLGIVQSFAIALTLTNTSTGQSMVTISRGAFIPLCVITLTAGTAFIMWLGEQITERGVGNGMSLIIFAGIVVGLPRAVADLFDKFKTGQWGPFTGLALIILMGLMVAVVGVIVFVEGGQRRIPVQYAKRVIGRRMSQGGQTYLPLRVNMAGVIPVIFAASIMAFPPTVGQLINSPWAKDLATFFSPNKWPYIVGESIFIILFTYFYTAVTFNPVDQAENLKKYGGFIPGVRPGRPTAEFLDRILARLTFPGALYLAAVAALPTILINQTSANFFFGGTSILIVIGVALDTMKQLEAQLMMRNYEGFLK